MAKSIGDQDLSYDARQHYLLQQNTRLNRVILVLLHGNKQIGITKLLYRVTTGMERIRMELMIEELKVVNSKYSTGVTARKSFNGRHLEDLSPSGSPI